MAKTITTTVTLHVKDMQKSRKFRYDANLGVIGGKHVVIEVPPGKPVQFEDEAEADRIIARFGGEVVDLPAHAVAPAKQDEPDDADIDAPAAKTTGKKSAATA